MRLDAHTLYLHGYYGEDSVFTVCRSRGITKPDDPESQQLIDEELLASASWIIDRLQTAVMDVKVYNNQGMPNKLNNRGNSYYE